MNDLVFRDAVRDEDAALVRRIAVSTGFFYPEEIDVAVELVDERLRRGTASGYHFVFAELSGRMVGYASYGPIACTVASYDLYWIVVDAAHRNQGLGTIILREAERRIAALGGSRVYIETSSRPVYEPTREFYRSRGYAEEARLRHFYGPNDDKVVFVKELEP